MALTRERGGHLSVAQTTATQFAQRVENILQALGAAVEPIHSQIIDAMLVYERDVLHDVTWRA